MKAIIGNDSERNVETHLEAQLVAWGIPRELAKGLTEYHTKINYAPRELIFGQVPYHLEDSAWSPRRVLRENTSHCYEGALFAAAALRVIGFPPLLLDLEAEHDTDHVLAIYKVDGHWGAVAKSNFTGCRYREPVYRSLRELVLELLQSLFQSARGADVADLLAALSR